MNALPLLLDEWDKDKAQQVGKSATAVSPLKRAMKVPLEDDIDRLTGFDAWRVLAARMRDDGRAVLARSFDRDQQDDWDPPQTADRHGRVKKKTEILEYAITLEAILAHHRTNWIDPPSLLR